MHLQHVSHATGELPCPLTQAQASGEESTGHLSQTERRAMRWRRESSGALQH